MFRDPYWAHIDAVNALAAHGIDAPAEWIELHGRFTRFAATEKPCAARLAAEIVSPTGADIELLRAAALAEETATSVDEATVQGAVRSAVTAELVSLYAPLVGKAYKAVAEEFNSTAKRFTDVARVADPELPSDSIVRSDERTRNAWLSGAALAQELDRLTDVVARAAALIGATGVDDSYNDDRDLLLLPLVCDPGKLHRRRVWEAWIATGTCGRWAALARLGVKLRAHPHPERLERYRAPMPMEGRWVRGPQGQPQIQHIDPEDPGAEAAFAAAAASAAKLGDGWEE